MFSLTVHGITKKWQRIKFVLRVAEFRGSHTGELIAQKLEGLVSDWGIPFQKVHAFVCDEGPNIKVVSFNEISIFKFCFRLFVTSWNLVAQIAALTRLIL